jgi:hypothetical protein
MSHPPAGSELSMVSNARRACPWLLRQIPPIRAGSSKTISSSLALSCPSCAPWRARWRGPAYGFSPCRPSTLAALCFSSLIAMHLALHFGAGAARIFPFLLLSHMGLLHNRSKQKGSHPPENVRPKVRVPSGMQNLCRSRRVGVARVGTCYAGAASLRSLIARTRPITVRQLGRPLIADRL